MKYRLFVHRRCRETAVRLLVSLTLLCAWPATSGGAEPDTLNIADSSPGYLVSMPWMPCADIDWPRAFDARQDCEGETGFSGQGRLGTDGRDREGLRRDTWYFLGYQVATIGILYLMPEGVSGWTEEQKEGYSMSIWWDNVTHPQIDSDDFYINYLLHPYWGAAYFVRAKERGYSDIESFWYSALLSSAYEFGVEALFEEPSIQDIIVTPVGGALVGMYFMDVRSNIREREISRGYRTRKDRWLWVLTDPLGSLNRKMDKLFGRDTELQIRAYRQARSSTRSMQFAPVASAKDRIYGITLSLRF